MNVQMTIGKLGKVLSANSPTILTGLGVAGLVGTTILAVRATPKALILIEKEKLRKVEGDDPDRYELPLTTTELIRTTWKCYIPSAIMGAVTITCIIGAHSINLRRNAALAGVYSLTEAALKEYQAKVVETIGEKKERKIKEEMAKDAIFKNPPKDSQIIITGKGDSLCLDKMSGRYFKSNIEAIRKLQNDLNEEMLAGIGGTITLNDVYDGLGLDYIDIGDILGWNLDVGKLAFQFDSHITPDGEPCLVIGYREDPIYFPS